jgi:large subunit ribosomal protein L20
MPRATRAAARRRRKKKIFKYAKGFRGARGRLYRTAVESVHKGWTYSFRDRKARKRDFRGLWITRINAAVRPHGLSYSQFVGALKKAQITIDRKLLAQLAVSDEKVFGELVGLVKKGSK